MPPKSSTVEVWPRQLTSYCLETGSLATEPAEPLIVLHQQLLRPSGPAYMMFYAAIPLELQVGFGQRAAHTGYRKEG